MAPRADKEWHELPYMTRAVQYLCGHYAAGLPLKPGGRKTSITLEAFRQLRDAGKVQTMLVIAPLRVCRQQWRQEAAKWTQFKGFDFALLHGPKKAKALKSGAEIYLINPEGLDWLCNQYLGRPLPFDVVCIDELTKFQNAQAKRHKSLRPRLKGVKYRWGLTGSLFAKGHMGVFGQQLILDDGAALGRFITHYRDRYFQVGFDGFKYDLLPGGEKRILDKLAPYWFYMDEEDYAQLPPLVDVPRVASMEPKEWKLYQQMKRDMIVQLAEGEVTAANAGAAYSKMAQMANGAVYLDDRSTAKIHGLKLDMLEELVDELDGEPILVAYEFNHDLDRLRERFGKDLPYLGKGTTAVQEDQWVRQWNNRELPILAAHPQSAGHGLNMQEGQAYNVAWFSVTWDWENYDQFIRRVRRDGNTQTTIFNHILIVQGTIDELKLAAVRDKDFTESRLLTGLNTVILREQEETNTGELTMVAKLSRPDSAPTNGGWGDPNTGPQQQQPAQEQTPQQPAGWGQAAQQGGDAQREAIQTQVAPQPDRAAEAAAAFGGGVNDQINQIGQTDYGAVQDPQQAPAQEQPPQQPAGWGQAAQQADAPPPDHPHPQESQGGQPVSTGVTDKSELNKMKKPELIDFVQQLQADGATATAPVNNAATDDAAYIVQATNRATVLAAVVASSPDATVAELVDSARDMMDFVERG